MEEVTVLRGVEMEEVIVVEAEDMTAFGGVDMEGDNT